MRGRPTTFQDIFGPALQRFGPNGDSRGRSPDLDMWEDFGLQDKILTAKFIEQIGREQFIELVLAMVSPSSNGRPKTDYSRWVSKFLTLKSLRPDAGDSELAADVAKKAFAEKDWSGFSPPASEKAMAQSIVNHVKAMNPHSLSDRRHTASTHVSRLRQTLAKRVNALDRWAERIRLIEAGLAEVQAGSPKDV